MMLVFVASVVSTGVFLRQVPVANKPVPVRLSALLALRPMKLLLRWVNLFNWGTRLLLDMMVTCMRGRFSCLTSLLSVLV